MYQCFQGDKDSNETPFLKYPLTYIWCFGADISCLLFYDILQTNKYQNIRSKLILVLIYLKALDFKWVCAMSESMLCSGAEQKSFFKILAHISWKKWPQPFTPTALPLTADVDKISRVYLVLSLLRETYRSHFWEMSLVFHQKQN